MSNKKSTNKASPSQIDELLGTNVQNDQESQEAEKSPDLIKVEDFLGDPDLTVGEPPFSDDVRQGELVTEKVEVEKSLPKYDYLKINSRFLDSDNVGQVFKKNTATGKYDANIAKIKDKYETLLSLGYEIHNQTYLETDYILFTFMLPSNDKAASK